MDYNDEEEQLNINVSKNDNCINKHINAIEYYQMNPFQRMKVYGISDNHFDLLLLYIVNCLILLLML